MLQAFLILIGFQLAGEALHALLRLPVPGMVLGMLLLLAALLLRDRIAPRLANPGGLDSLAETLHVNFGLLFVPAGVGLLAHLALLAAEAPVIIAALLVPTLLNALVISALLAVRLRRPPAPVVLAP